MQKFNFARYLSAIAAAADEFDKAMLSPHELRQLELCRDVMHTTAQEFAAERVGELYDSEELSAEDLMEIRRAACLANTQAAGLALIPRNPDEVYSPRTIVIEQRAAA